MKISPLATGLLGLFLLVSATPKQELYQVMSSHPHDVAEFSAYITTVKKENRLWLVHLKDNTPSHVKKNFRLTDGSDVKTYSLTQTMKAPFEVSALIQDFTKRLDVNAIKADVETLSTFKTRAAGTADNQKTHGLLKDIFSKLGYTVYAPCYKSGACSVVAEKVGESAGAEVILLMAHFDSVGKSFAGADDNGSGTAVLLEVARVLKDYSNKKTIRFFATNGEENGLYGAEHYAAQLEKEGKIQNVSLAINMDMVGYNSNGIVELETNQPYENLALWFASLAQQYTSLKTKITLGAWGSDHVPFLDRKVPTLLTIEDWSTKTPCYHQACDTPETLNYEYATEIAKLNLAAIMTKDVQ